MLFAILTIAGGLLAASSFIIARKPSAGRIFAKIAPYQGTFGVVLFAYGVYYLITAGIPLIRVLSAAPLWSAVTLSAIVLDIVLGFLLGFGLLNKLLLAKSIGTERAQAMLTKVARFQAPLGLAAAGVGVAVLLNISM